MHQHAIRKHPRVYNRKLASEFDNEENVRYLDLGATTAIGIVALAFVKGMFWGYMLKRALDKY